MASKETIRDNVAATALFAPVLTGLPIEMLCVAFLDGASRLLDLAVVPGTGATAVRVPIRSLMRAALVLDAQAMILAHNHPGGSPGPSAADRRSTARLAETARALGIRIVDHLIFAGSEVTGFRELGLL